MTIIETKLTTVGSKKVVEPNVLNAEILPSTTKRANFDQVAAGVCPHENAELLPPTRTTGAGEKAVCTQCGHTWYINKRIRTCKCLTCSGAKWISTERKIASRIENQADKKAGGPFWIRTRDPSLIRTVL